MGERTSFPRNILDREKVFIVTGANTGIGYETAKWIAMLGAKVILACRSEENARKAIQRIKQEHSEEIARNTDGILMDDIDVEFMEVDLASLKSTKSFIDNFIQSGRKLHCFIWNAGLAFRSLEHTEDGNEIAFQVNYLSQLLIAVHLIPVMKKSGCDDCRIVMVTSHAHHYAPKFDTARIQPQYNTADSYDQIDCYGNSKLYQVMAMYFLNRRLKGSNITAVSVYPGFTKSGLNSQLQCTGLKALVLIVLTQSRQALGFYRSAYEGAETVIYAAISREMKGARDVYYYNCKPSPTATHAKEKESQESLLKESLKLLEKYIPSEMAKHWLE